MQAFPRLFSPIRIGTLEIKNRICFAATSSELAGTDGFVTDDMVEFYAERARGGTGLIVVETTYVAHEGKRLPRNPMLHEDRFIPGQKRIVDAAHDAGAKIAVQLCDGGREAVQAVTGMQPRGPSAVASHYTGGGRVTDPREMTIEQIHELVKLFADGAQRAREAGYDAVELHGAHGYLISQFLSPAANVRQDQYGGSVRARSRFYVELIQAIKQRAGQDYPVICRLNSSDYSEQGGLEFDACLETIGYLEEAGADSISLSAGVHASRPYMIIPGMDVEVGWNRKASAVARSRVKIPVMTVGRIHDPELAEDILQSGDADIICLSRSLIADPHFAMKAEAGMPEQITPCISCNECVANVQGHRGVACTVNPMASQEFRLKPVLEAVPPRRRVAIVGAGAAGLSAAVVAARRGHEVHVFEEASKLGGQLNIAHVPPHREAIEHILSYYRREVSRLGVNIHLGRSPSPEDIRKVAPDSIIMAIGARSVRPTVSGAGQPHVLTGWKVLAGIDRPGNKSVVVGGGLVGVEVADFLSEQGKSVVIVARSDILKKAVHSDRIHFEDRLAEQKIEVLTHTDVIAIGDNWVDLNSRGSAQRLSGIDSVIFCTGYEDRMADTEPFKSLGVPIQHAGDVLGSRKFFEAIKEGAMAALNVA